MRNHKDAPTLGLPPMPRHFRKYLIAQIIGGVLVLYVYYTLNGGFIPRFLVPRLPYFNVGPDVGCLLFFDVNSDASKIRWEREANSRQSVMEAMKSVKIFGLIANEMNSHSIPWDNCIALGCDNANVMVGKESGVYGCMLKEQPNLYLRGCVCHLIHIAAENDDKVHMISGDIILKGQGTKSQTLVPIMGKPPVTKSDITLKEWLQEVRFGNKGIRLHIHSPEALDISLQVLSDFNKQNAIKFPVWLHADVLKGPHGEEAVIDIQRFVRTQQRLFPKCTLSFGWTTGTHTDLSQSAYTWESVWDMLNLVQEFDFKDQPIVFQARLSLVHNSVPQLKWLCDNVKSSSLMIWHEDDINVVNVDVMYVSYRFPPHSVYFDLNHDRFQSLLDQYRHFSRDKVAHHVLMRDERVFKPDGWWKMGFHRQKNSVLASTEGIILTTPIVYLTSKSKYLPTSEIYIQGRIMFFNRDNRDAEDHLTGLNIYVRPTEYERFDNIVGIRCFIGFGGEIEVTGSFLPDNIEKFTKSARVTPTHTNCYRFKIVDDRTQIQFWITSLHDCTTLESVAEPESETPLLTVPIPASLFSKELRPFILKMEDVKRQVLIDELSIKHK